LATIRNKQSHPYADALTGLRKNACCTPTRGLFLTCSGEKYKEYYTVCTIYNEKQADLNEVKQKLSLGAVAFCV
jgi:hypothetical protein